MILTTSPSLSSVLGSEGRGEKWETTLLTLTEVGKARPEESGDGPSGQGRRTLGDLDLFVVPDRGNGFRDELVTPDALRLDGYARMGRMTHSSQRARASLPATTDGTSFLTTWPRI